MTPPSGRRVGGTLHNKAVSARACMVLVPDLDPEIKVPTARHIDLLGDEHRQGEGLRGSSSSASRLLRRYMKPHAMSAPSVARFENLKLL